MIDKLTVKEMSQRKYHEFSKIFAVAMIDNNTTQKELSQKTGIARCMLSNYYRGFALPPVENLYKIAKALNLDVEKTLQTIIQEKALNAKTVEAVEIDISDTYEGANVYRDEPIPPRRLSRTV